jgi:hypothetical protein
VRRLPHASSRHRCCTGGVTDVCIDGDEDAIAGSADHCPTAFDPAQADDDADGLGDACDPCPAAPVPASPDLLSSAGRRRQPARRAHPAVGEVPGPTSYEVLVATSGGRLARWYRGRARLDGLPVAAGAARLRMGRAGARRRAGSAPGAATDTFTTCALPPQSLLGPAENAATPWCGCSWSWSPLSGASGLRGAGGAGRRLLAGAAGIDRARTLFHPCSAAGKTYHWRVRGARRLRRGALQPCPRLHHLQAAGRRAEPPSDGAILAHAAPVLDWQDVAGATNYGRGGGARSRRSPRSCAARPTWESLLRPSTPPLRGGPAPYYWRVAAFRRLRRGGSPVFQFQVCPVPTRTASTLGSTSRRSPVEAAPNPR